MKVEILKAIGENQKEIAAVSIECWKDAYKDIFPSDYLDNLCTESRTKLREYWFANPNHLTLIAKLNNKIVGFCDYGVSRHLNHAPGEIHSLYVLPSLKGKGIGKKLLTEAKDNLIETNLYPFIVTTLKANINAQKFYEISGFSKVGEISTQVGNNFYPEIVYLYG